MDKKIISKYDKCSHVLVYTGYVEKDNDVIYRCGCAKCKLDERVLDRELDTLSREQLAQRKYITAHNGNIPGYYIPKFCNDIDKLNNAYKDFINSKNYNVSEEEIINEITKQIRIVDTLNYLEARADKEYEKIRAEQYAFYDNCCHSKIITGISKKTNEIRYGCPKCMLDERILDFDVKKMSGVEKIVYDYLAAGYFGECGRKIEQYYPNLPELHGYYERLNLPNTYRGYQQAEDEIIRHILIKNKDESVIFRK